MCCGIRIQVLNEGEKLWVRRNGVIRRREACSLRRWVPSGLKIVSGEEQRGEGRLEPDSPVDSSDTGILLVG